MAQPPPTTREKIAEFLEAHDVGLRYEQWYPASLGVVGFLIAFFIHIGLDEFDKLMKDVMTDAVTVAAILAGYQATIQVILLSMTKSRVIRKLKTHKLYGDLLAYIRVGTSSLILFIAIAMIVVYYYAAGGFHTHFRFVASLLAGLFVYSMAASARIMFIIMKLIHIAAAE